MRWGLPTFGLNVILIGILFKILPICRTVDVIYFCVFDFFFKVLE